MKLATGYAPFLIQMYATAAFEFNQGDNGWLMAEFAFMRSFFLIFVFPLVISWGRRVAAAPKANAPTDTVEADETSTLLPTSPGQFDATAGEQAVDEPIQLSHKDTDEENPQFDLVFLRWSLVVDGGLTTLAAFATKRWHIYLGKKNLSCRQNVF